MKQVTLKALSKSQIEAVIARIEERYEKKFEAAARKEDKHSQGQRKVELEALFIGLSPKMRKAVIAAVGGSTLPGITEAGHGYYKYRETGPYGEYTKAMKDLRFALVMANNTTYESQLKAFEAKLDALLK